MNYIPKVGTHGAELQGMWGWGKTPQGSQIIELLAELSISTAYIGEKKGFKLLTTWNLTLPYKISGTPHAGNTIHANILM